MTYLKNLLPIQTEHLLLRLLEPEETDLILRYIRENREHLARWEPTRPKEYCTEEFWVKQLREAQTQFFQGTSARFVLFRKEEPQGDVIGVCNFTNVIRGVFRACYLGYSIDRRFEGKGYMHEALEAALDFIFNKFHLHRVMANYMPCNERSGRLLKKLGFTVEGYARDYLEIAGKWEDHILTARVHDNKQNKDNTKPE